MAVDDVVEERVLIYRCCSVAVFAFAGHKRPPVTVVAVVAVVLVVVIADYSRIDGSVAPFLALRYIVVVDCKIKHGMRPPQCIFQGINATCLSLAHV